MKHSWNTRMRYLHDILTHWFQGDLALNNIFKCVIFKHILLLAVWSIPCVIACRWWPQDFIVSFNSLAPGKFEWNFRYVIFKWNLVIDGWGISCKIAILWMSLDFTDDQSTLVQVMAWCRQAASHYLSQCWPRSLLPYGVTKSEWANDKCTQFQVMAWCCHCDTTSH